jgi:hypothetical protein
MTCNCKINCDPCKCGPVEGERRKQDAFATLTANREAVIRRAQRALLTVLLETGSATADDVRKLVELPLGIGPKCFGAVPLPLARAGIIFRDGYTPTSRPTAHARPLSIWRLADREAALRWLADHLDLPDPADAKKETSDAQGRLFPITTNEPTPAVAAAGAGMEQWTQ